MFRALLISLFLGCICENAIADGVPSSEEMLKICNSTIAKAVNRLPISIEDEAVDIVGLECVNAGTVTVKYTLKTKNLVTPLLIKSYQADSVNYSINICEREVTKSVLESFNLQNNYVDKDGAAIFSYFFTKQDCSNLEDKKKQIALFKNYLDSIRLAGYIEASPEIPNIKKDKELIILLDQAKTNLTDIEFKLLSKDLEGVLFKDIEDSLASRFQFESLNNLIARGDFWPLEHSREQVLARINQLESRDLGNANITKETSHGIRAVSKLLEQGAYGEAQDIVITLRAQNEKLYSDKKEGYSMYVMGTFLTDTMDFRIAYQKGDLQNARAISDKIDRQLEAAISALHSLEGKTSADANVSILYLGTYLNYDLEIGSYDRVIARLNQLLKEVPEQDSESFEISRARSEIYKKLSLAYRASGKTKLADDAEMKSVKIDAITGQLDIGYYTQRFVTAVLKQDYDSAQKALIYTESLLDYLEPNFRKLETDILVVEKNYLMAVKAEKSHSKKLELFRKLNLDLAILGESCYLAFFHDVHNPSQDLVTYKNLYYLYKGAGQINFAAFYAKKYINNLQDFRNQLSSFNKDDEASITKKNEGLLKEFSITFFDVGDYQSSWACFQIIKEMQFLDFLRRKTLSDDFLTRLEITEKENDFYLKLKNTANEINTLETNLSKFDNTTKEYDLISRELAKKKERFSLLNNEFSNHLITSAKNNASKNPEKLASTISLEGGEASIQYLINQDFVYSVVAVRGSQPRSFNYKIKQTDLRILISEVQNQLMHREKVSQEKLAKLSEIFVKQQYDFIKSSNIQKVKLKTDDFLSLIPFGILEYQGKAGWDLFEIENVGLGKTKNEKTNLNQLSIFGATKGNNEFSSLPGVRDEVNLLMNIKSDVNRVDFLDDNFNKSNLLTVFNKSPSIIHIATHFKAFGNDSFTTKMLLGDGSVMSLNEIQNTIPSFNNDLLTLSACDTGNVMPSSISKNNEGLSNVFQLKGAKNIISTLWAIDDKATSRFMYIFYNLYLNNKISSSKALNLTQKIFSSGSISVLPKDIAFYNLLTNREILKDISDYKHPYYWAAFQLSSIP